MMLKKILDALGTARRALSSDLALIRSGLAGLDLTDKALASRAANFVASGDDASVLAALAALGGLPSEALGDPGLIGWGMADARNRKRVRGRPPRPA